MFYRFSLSKPRRETLEKMQREARQRGSMKLYQRSTALLLLDKGLYQEEVAAALGVCVRTVQKWLSLYLRGGVKTLRPRKSPGRPSYLTQEQKRVLFNEIAKGPQDCGDKGGVWTAAMIQDYILKKFQRLYSVKYLSQLLRQMGLSHIKPKFVYSLTRPEFKEQVLWIRHQIPQLLENVQQANGVLLWEDESAFQLQSNLIALQKKKCV